MTLGLPSTWKGDVENGRFIVKTTEYGNPAQEFYWEVKAVRADIDPLQVEVVRSSLFGDYLKSLIIL